MALKTHSLKFTRKIGVGADEVARAFTKASALQDWLCNTAQADPRPGGHIYLWWDDGEYANGNYTGIEPGKKVVFTWKGRGDAADTKVMVKCTAEEWGTLVTVTHSGFAADAQGKKKAAVYRRAWEFSMENLQSVLETGIDQRLARRPLLGIIPSELTPELAARSSAPVKAGLYLHGVIDDMGAQAAGLQPGDVIVAIAGKKVTGFASLVDAIGNRQGGDQVSVGFYRGGERSAVEMELTKRPLPEYPPTAATLAEVARDGYEAVRAEFTKFLEGVSEAQAEFSPLPGEWSVKEILAHFILTERDFQSWLAEMLNDGNPGQSLEYRPNVPIRLVALLGVRPTLAALMDELKCSQDETVSMLTALPDSFVARKHLYNRVAVWEMQYIRGHLYGEHLEQIQSTLAAARAAEAQPANPITGPR